MSRLLIFGPGYTASRLAATVEAEGWRVDRIGRDALAGAAPLIDAATHILSSVPPADDADPVLAAHGTALARASARWIGYLSSSGVYGDTGGAWVDEAAPLAGRRGGRMRADLGWQAIGARVFRLPGIYGPGRSALERVRAGQAHRIDLPEQVFSRIHVDDIIAAVRASLGSEAEGVFNIADNLPASQNAVIEEACWLTGAPLPPVQSLEEAGLSRAALAFYGENRRVANGRAVRLLGWRPRHPTYREGLRALIATSSPAIASAAPAAASHDQR